MSMGLNSTRQPMSVSAVGGFLNLREFQLVDWRFSKLELPSTAGHLVHHLLPAAIPSAAFCFSPSYFTGHAQTFITDSDESLVVISVVLGSDFFSVLRKGPS